MSTPEQWVILGVFGAIAVCVLFVAAIAGMGRLGELPEPVRDQFVPQLPDRPLEPGDLSSARFAHVGRGYSIEQVDRLLAHAARQWAADRTPGAGA